MVLPSLSFHLSHSYASSNFSFSRIAPCLVLFIGAPREDTSAGPCVLFRGGVMWSFQWHRSVPGHRCARSRAALCVCDLLQLQFGPKASTQTNWWRAGSDVIGPWLLKQWLKGIQTPQSEEVAGGQGNMGNTLKGKNSGVSCLQHSYSQKYLLLLEPVALNNMQSF